MAKSDLAIRLELEPVVKITCTAFDCRFNLKMAGFASCNLKLVNINKYGKCMMFEAKEKTNAYH